MEGVFWYDFTNHLNLSPQVVYFFNDGLYISITHQIVLLSESKNQSRIVKYYSTTDKPYLLVLRLFEEKNKIEL